MAYRQHAQPQAAPDRANSIARLTNLAGAAVSLALILGVGVWGYKLLVRDVSGVPVVRAAEGPLRIQPEDPGGQQALHQGLSVNDVAAEGAAAKPADRLILAPEPLDLSLEDKPLAELVEVSTAAETEALAARETEDAATDGVHLASMNALAEDLAAGVPPLGDLPAKETTPTPEAEPAVAQPAPDSGLGRSLRPQLRPAALKTSAGSPAPARAAFRDIDPAEIPAGSRLAQLGAFESADVARKEWTRLRGRFGEYLDGKDRVIQKAQSGGRTFYRLRAVGFDGLSDARRFCSALVAENAECIPVVTR